MASAADLIVELTPVRARRLTARQYEVLVLLCEGLPNKLIARRMGISPSTAKKHVSDVLNALGVCTRLEAALAGYRTGLVAANVLNANEVSGVSPQLDGPPRRSSTFDAFVAQLV